MNREMAIEWLNAAYDDILAIEEMIDNEVLTHIVAFHAQQSIEKSFKALIEFNGKTIPKRHDLIQLNVMVSDYIDVENHELLDILNTLYVESRYPGEFGLLPNGKPSTKDAKDFFKLAKQIHDRATQVISQSK